MSQEPLSVLRQRLSLPERLTNEWIEMLRQRDEEAFRQLWRLVYNECCRNFRGWRNFQDNVLDAANNAVIAIINKVDSDEAGSIRIFERFVIGVVYFKCIDIQRQIQYDRRNQSIDGLDNDNILEITYASDTRNPQHETLDELLWDLLNTCIHQLDPENRQIALWYVEGLGPDEIAVKPESELNSGAISRRWVTIRKRINRSLDRCVARLETFDYIIFYLYLDRSKRGFRVTAKDKAKLHDHQGVDKELHENSVVRAKSLGWILAQLRALKSTLDQGGDPELPDHGNILITVQWVEMNWPHPFGIEELKITLHRIIAQLSSCISAIASPKQGA